MLAIKGCSTVLEVLLLQLQATFLNRVIGYGQDDKWNHSKAPTIIQPEIKTSMFNDAFVEIWLVGK
jgi:hypothetical protein